MKTKSVIFLMGLLLLNSCIVKSLNPFYTADSISYDKRIEGDWESSAGDWKIFSFEDGIDSNFYTKVHNTAISINNKDRYSEKKKKDWIKKFKDRYLIYFVEYDKNDTIIDNMTNFSSLIATPFKVGDKLFLDCLPFTSLSKSENEDQVVNLEGQHSISTHSVCLVEFKDDGHFKLKWLDEKTIRDLIDDNSISIRHEKLGSDDEDFVLTASSEELYRFLEKFMFSSIKDKWDEDLIFNLYPYTQRD